MRDFMHPLMQHFPMPEQVTDKALFYRPYVEALGGYSEKVLMESVKRIIATRKFPTFPLLAECIEMVGDVDEEIYPPKAYNNAKTYYPEWDRERIIAANKLMNSDIGRQACEEGWQITLWDFLRENKRLPEIAEWQTLRARSLANWAETDAYMASNGSLTRIIKPLYDAFQKRRKLLKKIANGELPPTATMEGMDL